MGTSALVRIIIWMIEISIYVVLHFVDVLQVVFLWSQGLTLSLYGSPFSQPWY